MADNKKIYGFRWSKANGGDYPKPLTCRLATAYQGAINGGSNVHVRPGDIIRRLSTGYWELSDGSEGAGGGETVDAVVVGIKGHKDADSGYFKHAALIPGATAYTDVQNEASQVYAVPTHWGLWEADCDDKTTATTYAAYHAFIGENVDHVLTTGSEPKADPMIDISGHGTGSAQWAIWGISESVQNRDFSGLYVKLILAPNEASWPGFSSGNTGV